MSPSASLREDRSVVSMSLLARVQLRGGSADTSSMAKEGRLRIMDVLIVEDHPMVCQVIRLGCEQRPGLRVVGECGTGTEAIDRCLELEPDVMILDLGLPDMDGIEVIRRVKAAGSVVRVLVVTGRDDRGTVLRALRAGADGYLEKTSSIRDIGASAEAVGSGTRILSMEHRHGLQQEIRDLAHRMRESSKTAASLTPRERQVLDLITEGLSTRQMARRLGVSERTVESHISRLYQKLDVRTRVQALHRAAGLGLVELR